MAVWIKNIFTLVETCPRQSLGKEAAHDGTPKALWSGREAGGASGGCQQGSQAWATLGGETPYPVVMMPAPWQ